MWMTVAKKKTARNVWNDENGKNKKRDEYSKTNIIPIIFGKKSILASFNLWNKINIINPTFAN